MSIAIPVVNGPTLYVDNLQLTWTANATMTIAAGAARDSTNVNDITLAATATINTATVGKINGIDAAAVAASTRYNVFIVGDSSQTNPVGGLLSTSLTPTLPYGYDMYRRIGTVFTDGSKNLLLAWWYGNARERTMYYDVGISALSGGSSTSYANISLVASAPAVASLRVIFDIAYTANSATNTAQFLPYGSSATNGVVRYGCGVAAAQVGQITVPTGLNAGVPEVQYKVASSDSLTLLTTGYIETL